MSEKNAKPIANPGQVSWWKSTEPVAPGTYWVRSTKGQEQPAVWQRDGWRFIGDQNAYPHAEVEGLEWSSHLDPAGIEKLFRTCVNAQGEFWHLYEACARKDRSAIDRVIASRQKYIM